ncbi:MAG TPA: hypothetical protein VFA27_08260 [Vicinamibacterales bacterium]|nr:hypothetical protein [Vicinamibacterales bacterium]
MAHAVRATKRGRPPKFGRPGQVVAVTLPAEVVRGLRRINPDLAWAIVKLFERSRKGASRPQPARADSELVAVANGRSLIVVNRGVLKQLPGVNVIPLNDERAFLAFDRNATLADLELAIVERLQDRSVRTRERRALSELRTHVQRWRHDPNVHCEMRSIIVLEKVRAARRRSRPTPA